VIGLRRMCGNAYPAGECKGKNLIFMPTVPLNAIFFAHFVGPALGVARPGQAPALQTCLVAAIGRAVVCTRLENRMKCGVGKCGRCNVGSFDVCKEGSILTMAQLERLPADHWGHSSQSRPERSWAFRPPIGKTHHGRCSRRRRIFLFPCSTATT